jgi:hypothetical protein
MVDMIQDMMLSANPDLAIFVESAARLPYNSIEVVCTGAGNCYVNNDTTKEACTGPWSTYYPKGFPHERIQKPFLRKPEKIRRTRKLTSLPRWGIPKETVKYRIVKERYSSMFR